MNPFWLCLIASLVLLVTLVIYTRPRKWREVQVSRSEEVQPDGARKKVVSAFTEWTENEVDYAARLAAWRRCWITGFLVTALAACVICALVFGIAHYHNQ